MWCSNTAGVWCDFCGFLENVENRRVKRDFKGGCKELQLNPALADFKGPISFNCYVEIFLLT